jgi:hypothetical protein
MRHDAPDHIQVVYYTSCQSSSDEMKQSNKCDELKIGEEVEFKVEIKVLSCPDNQSDWNQTFKIFPVGSQEAILVHLEMNCDCSCEHQDYHVSNMCLLLKSAMRYRLTKFVFSIIILLHSMIICALSIMCNRETQHDKIVSCINSKWLMAQEDFARLVAMKSSSQPFVIRDQ